MSRLRGRERCRCFRKLSKKATDTSPIHLARYTARSYVLCMATATMLVGWTVAAVLNGVLCLVLPESMTGRKLATAAVSFTCLAVAAVVGGKL